MDNQPIHVLVIDDDASDVKLVENVLQADENQTYTLHHSISIDAARRLLLSVDVNVVLLDLGLTGSAGIATLERFRSVNEQLPVIVFTGLEDEWTASGALKSNAQDYICKNDFTAHTLSRAIRHAIHRQASVHEVRHLLAKLRENEEVLRRKNKRLKSLYETAHTFVDNVSHEFRTPLTVIKEYVSLVRDGTMGDICAEQQRFLQIAEDRADDLNTMIDDMLDGSRLEAGLLNVCRRSIPIRQIVDRVLPWLKRKAELKELSFQVDVPHTLPDVFCDAEKVERILINLTINAMKFTRSGGKVEIWATEDERDITIGVTDTGPGIPDDQLSIIFERFAQAETDARQSCRGFGLGLNIANELVKLNLGSMHVSSRVGAGSTFQFTLPKDDSVEVMKRYLDRLSRQKTQFATLVEASISPTDRELSSDVDTFLSLLTRGRDLCFRASPDRWLVVLPEVASEAELFVARAEQEVAALNRNRPQGPLPDIEFEIRGSWTDLNVSSDEMVERVRSCLNREAPIVEQAKPIVNCDSSDRLSRPTYSNQ